MSLWAIVPVKPLRRGKSRLSSVLSEEERTALNFSMLAHTLKTISQVPYIDQSIVISRDPAALALAREHKARTVQEEGSPQLNHALSRATAFAGIYGASAVLVLPADLPLLQPEDLNLMIGAAKNPPVIVIAPDRREDGTNALLVNPAGKIRYSFGVGSYMKHRHQAQLVGVRLEIVSTPGLGLDLDLPADLELVRKLQTLDAGELITN